jgi:hypothetical protein
MTMRTLLILAAIVSLSASAFAQTAAPKAGGKRLKQVKPSAPIACKLLGSAKGKDLGWRLRGRTRTSGRHTHARARSASADPGSKSPR